MEVTENISELNQSKQDFDTALDEFTDEKQEEEMENSDNSQSPDITNADRLKPSPD